MSVPATDWKEVVPPDEDARFIGYAEKLQAMQHRRARARAPEKPDRALHAKPNLHALAEFSVLPDLPAHARVGLFAEPASYHAYVRFSNGQGVRQPDRMPDVRGIGIKLLGVPGTKLIPGMQDATTQDFLLIKSASTPFRNADEFVAFVLAGENQALFVPRAIAALGFVRTWQILRGIVPGLAERVRSLATTRYYQPVPSQLGLYAVHFGLWPHASNAPNRARDKRGSSREYLGEELAERLREGPVSYDFRLQHFRDEQRTPIEDASIEWTEAVAPSLTVARLTLPQQDVNNARGRQLSSFVENLSFDPFHTRQDMRPLGNMMRARNHAYRLSTTARGASPEPSGAQPLHDIEKTTT